MTKNGRLIDAGALKEKIKEWADRTGEGIIGQYYFELMRCIDDTPTVIETEEVKK